MRTTLVIDNVEIFVRTEKKYPKVIDVNILVKEFDMDRHMNQLSVEASKPLEALHVALNELIAKKDEITNITDHIFFDKLDIHAKFLGAYISRKKYFEKTDVSDVEGFYTILDMFKSDVEFNDENRYQFQRIFDEVFSQEIQDLDYEQIYPQFYKWAKRFFCSEQYNNEDLSEVDAMVDFLNEIKPFVKFD